MLETFRNIGQSWVAKALLVLIVISFGLWGIEGYFSNRASTNDVAKVDGVPISKSAFDERYKQEMDRIRQMMGKDFNPQLLQSAKFKDQILEGLISYQILINETRRLGLAVTDADVVRFIQNLPVFSGDKGFSKTRYVQILSQQGLTPAKFESQVREELAVRQLEQSLSSVPLTTSQEVGDLYALSEESRKAQVAILPAQRFLKEVAVTPAEEEQYYKAHQAEFKLPERVKVNYVILSPEQFAGKVNVSDSELQAAYDKDKAKFTVPEQRKARHILIPVPQNASAAEVKKAQAQADSIEKQLQAGANFAELAKKYSGDPGSASQGGELGFFSRGMMVKPFEDAVFSMKPGQISPPIRTPFGFHIIQLEDIKPEHVKSFDEVKPELEADIRKQKADQAYNAAVEKFKDMLFTQQKQGLEPIAKEFGLSVQESGWLMSGQPGQGPFANPAVESAAFSPKVLQGDNSEALDLPGGGLIGMHLVAHEPAKQQSLAEAKDAVDNALKQQKADALAKSNAQALLKAVQSGQDLMQAAQAKGFQAQEITFSRRNAEQMPPEVVQGIFKAPTPAPGKVSTGLSDLPGGAVVYAVESVARPAPASMPPAVRQQISDFLQSQRGNEVFRSYLHALRAKADIKVFKDKL